MTTSEQQAEYLVKVRSLIEALITATGEGTVIWRSSSFYPDDLDGLASVPECYEASSGDATYYIYKRLALRDRSRMFSMFGPMQQSVLEIKMGNAKPLRLPYLPVTDELLLIASRNVLQFEQKQVAKLTDSINSLRAH